MILIFATVLFFQQAPSGYTDWITPSTIAARHVDAPLLIDGRLSEAAWVTADWSAPFVDITGDEALAPVFETRTALLWDDSALYIGARLQEPHVWGSLTKRDTVIYYDNDFEFFFDPDGDNHRYGEVEINALNTVWDLMLEKPYRDRGPAVNGWDLSGMQHAVDVQGSLNDPSDVDEGWTVEIRIPWSDIQSLSPLPLPPHPGTQWRINFSRVQWPSSDSAGVYRKTSRTPDNWVWSPIGVVNMHMPERWGILEFVAGGSSGGSTISYPYEAERRFLMEYYYAQKRFMKLNQRWATTLDELGEVPSAPLSSDAHIILSNGGYEIILPLPSAGSGGSYSVDHRGRLRVQTAD